MPKRQQLSSKLIALFRIIGISFWESTCVYWICLTLFRQDIKAIITFLTNCKDIQNIFNVIKKHNAFTYKYEFPRKPLQISSSNKGYILSDQVQSWKKNVITPY